MFIDGYSSYNQIYLVEEDIYKTIFHCPGLLGFLNVLHVIWT